MGSARQTAQQTHLILFIARFSQGYLRSAPIVLANGVTLVLALSVVVMKLRFDAGPAKRH